MTKQEITALTLKLCAIYILIQLYLGSATATIGLGFAITQWFPDAKEFLAYSLCAVGLALPALLSYVIWRQSDKLLDFPAGDISADPKYDFHSILQPILCGVGVLIVCQGVPQAILHTTWLVREVMPQNNGLEGDINLDTFIVFCSSWIVVFIGLTLIWGRAGWSKVIYKMRYSGMEK
jgi:hypothetical protein